MVLPVSIWNFGAALQVAFAQQTELTQKPEAHSFAAAQVWPVALSSRAPA